MLPNSLQTLMEEKVISISKLTSSPRRHLKGIVRVVDNGKSIGVFLEEKLLQSVFQKWLEDLEAQNPVFWKSLDKSRRSGRISAQKIEKSLAL